MRPRSDHTCTLHEPGARACYGTHSCRCRACTDAATRWQRHFNHAKTTGRKLTVDAAPIAQHVARLLAAGMTQQNIADAAGVARGTVRNLREGRVQRVSHVTAGRLLGVAPRSAGGHATVPAEGTARRLQSLAYMGWDCEALAPMIGLSAGFLRHLRAGTRRTVHAATRDRVHAVWDRLSLVPHVGPGANRARMFAARHSWAPPLAWDDDTIDDPDAQPHPARDDTPRRGLSGRPARFDLDDLAFLASLGLSVTQAADRLGVTKSTIEHRCERADRRDLLAQLQHKQGGILMARIRTLKPSFWGSPTIAPLTRDARLLAIGLMSYADDDGRFLAAPNAINGYVFPNDDLPPTRVSRWLAECETAEFVHLYSADGVRYGCIPTWHLHQVIDRYMPSTLPVPIVECAPRKTRGATS